MLRRRAPAAGYAFGVVLVVVLLTILVSPARHVAEATLEPAGAEVLHAELREELTQTCRAPEFLAQVAAASSQDPADLPLDVEVRPAALKLIVEGPSEDQAKRARDRAVALLLAAFEPQEAPEAAPVTTNLEAVVAPLRETRERVEACSARLTALREVEAAHDDPTLAQQRDVIHDRIREDEVTLSGLHAQLETWSERVAELEQQVETEALVAYQAEQEQSRRDEIRRQEERRRLQALRQVQPARPTHPEHAEDPAAGEALPRATPKRLELLERELERMRTRRTDRHPAVRRLLREIEAERRLSTSLAPEPERSLGEPLPRDVERNAPATTPPWERPIADGEPDAAAAAPQALRQKAPSYRSLVSAQDAEADSLRAIRVLEEQLAVRRRGLAEQDERLHAVAPLRAEITALEQQLSELEQLRDQQQARVERLRAAQAAPPPAPRPGLVLSSKSPPPVVTAQAGPVALSTGLLLALLAAIAVAVGTELRDRSFHDPDELADRLGLPVLGVIPHGRGH